MLFREALIKLFYQLQNRRKTTASEKPRAESLPTNGNNCRYQQYRAAETGSKRTGDMIGQNYHQIS